MKKLLGILVLGFLYSGNACAETFNEEKDKLPITPESIGEWEYTCKKEDFKKYVATIEGCIALQHLGKIDKSKKKLVVFLHIHNIHCHHQKILPYRNNWFLWVYS